MQESSDIQALLPYLNLNYGSSDVVPEPTSFVLASLGIASLFFVRRKNS